MLRLPVAVTNVFSAGINSSLSIATCSSRLSKNLEFASMASSVAPVVFLSATANDAWAFWSSMALCTASTASLPAKATVATPAAANAFVAFLPNASIFLPSLAMSF